jgi:putative Holliday junction resolvase
MAISDPMGWTAQPLQSLEVRGIRHALRQVREIVRQRQVRAVVIGLPLQMSGEEGTAASEARDFAERLERGLEGVAIRLWDERLTTVEARRRLIETGSKSRRRKGVVDAVAATLILEGFLAAHPSSEGDPGR